MKSPLVYPGKKQGFVLSRIQDIAETMKYSTWIEPFVGGGGSILNIPYSTAHVSDKEWNITNVWEFLLSNNAVNEMDCISWCHTHYYINRNLFNQINKDIKNGAVPSQEVKNMMACLFMYLTNLSWGGLTRFSSSGDFNVNFGHKNRVNLKEKIQSFIPDIQKKNIRVSYAQDCISFIKKIIRHEGIDTGGTFLNLDDAVLYLDPPYHNTRSHYQYNVTVEQREEMLALSLAFPKVICSDSYNEYTVKTYKAFGFTVERVITFWNMANSSQTELLCYRNHN